MSAFRILNRPRALLALAAAALAALPAGADETTTPAAARMRADVSYLADDARGGRGTGTPGIAAAGEYIAAVFREIGLTPAAGADGYYQPFEVPELQLSEDAEIDFEAKAGEDVEARAGEDYMPITRAGAAIEDAPLLFAGYGITADDEPNGLRYDDYDGVDATGKIVLILRGEPQADDEDSPFEGKESTRYSFYRHKARNAEDHGARGILIVNSASYETPDQDELLPLAAAGSAGADIPLIMVTRDLADRLLKRGGAPSLETLEATIDEDLKPQSRDLEGWSVDAEYRVERGAVPARNVIGVLEGSGPLADETIVVGAHYDHLGSGGPGSLAPGDRSIHNGADDNASGTAMVMELARRLAARRDPLPRRVVFMLFSGEERGLLGSRHYVEHPLYPLETTVAMLNFDMVGRLTDDRGLIIFGAGTVPGLSGLVEGLGASQGLPVKNVLDTSGVFFQSDHASFYRKDVPVFFAFTGDHADYHRPSDDFDKINYEGMARIADLAELLLLDLARRPERPEFIKLPEQRRVAAFGGGHGAYFGSRPAYGVEEAKGVPIDGTSEGSPAEKAGLKAGDVVVKFGGMDIGDINDYMAALVEHKPGDEVEVIVLRDGKEVTLKAKLASRRSASEE